MTGDQLAHVRRPALVQAGLEAVGRTCGEHVLGQRAREQPVHPADGVAQRHRPERVPVIAAPNGEQPRTPSVPERTLILQAHLDRHLDRHRAGVGKEHRLKALRRHCQQRLGQAHRRLVRESPEHHVRHLLKLGFERPIECRVAVAVNGTPPRGHPVDQLTPVRQLHAHAFG